MFNVDSVQAPILQGRMSSHFLGQCSLDCEFILRHISKIGVQF